MAQRTNQPYDPQPAIQERLQKLADFLSCRPTPVPPEVRTRLMAQVAYRRSQATEHMTLPYAWKSWLVPAMAAMLVLSLGVNIWWGLQHQALSPSRAPRVDARVIATLSQAGSTYQFQKRLQHPDTWHTYLADYAKHSAEPTVIHSFAAPHKRSVFVHMGRLYAESLAALHSAAYDMTVMRLEALTEALHHVHAPDVLVVHLRDVEQQLRRAPQHHHVNDILALFEPLYEDVYASNLPEAVSGFRIGSDLTNLTLASASGDPEAIGRGVQILERDIRRLAPPDAVLAVLAQLERLVTDRGFSSDDMARVYTLVQTLRDLLQAP